MERLKFNFNLNGEFNVVTLPVILTLDKERAQYNAPWENYRKRMRIKNIIQY